MPLKLINLTPYALNIRTTADGPDLVVLPGAGDDAARIATHRTHEPPIELMQGGEQIRIPFSTVKYGAVEKLPAPTKDTAYVVSLVVREAARNSRQIHDLLVPGELVRDDEGKIIACVGLAQ